jgi:uncharacterized protein (DUF302 family)
LHYNSSSRAAAEPPSARILPEGDPLIGLYAPIRVYRCEDKGGKAWLEYDQPSSFLGQFDSADTDKVAKPLHDKFEWLTKKAAA